MNELDFHIEEEIQRYRKDVDYEVIECVLSAIT